jgi:predicted nucleic acid-binding Zn ribbon protein
MIFSEREFIGVEFDKRQNSGHFCHAYTSKVQKKQRAFSFLFFLVIINYFGFCIRLET